MLWTTRFWKGAAERAIKTFAQSEIAAVGMSAGIGDVAWPTVLGIGALATVLSVLTSILNADFTAGAPETTDAR